MTDKSSRWSMTVYEEQYKLLEHMPPDVAEWGWQDEVCPDTQRSHKQGYLRTKSQMRFSALRKILPGIHLEIAKDWNALKQYCTKSDTRDPNGEQVHQLNNIPSKYTYASEVAERLVEQCDYDEWSNWLTADLCENIKAFAILDIESGRLGIEWIIIDPNWKLLWKETGKAMLIRAYKKRQTDRQTPVI